MFGGRMERRCEFYWWSETRSSWCSDVPHSLVVRNFVVIQPITSTSSSQPITEYSVRPTTWRSRRRTVSASQADHHSWSRLLRPQQSPLSSVQRPPTTVAGGKEEQKTKKQYQPLNYDKVLLLIRFISSNDSVSFKSYCDAHTEYLG